MGWRGEPSIKSNSKALLGALERKEREQMKKTEKELEEMGIYSERNYYSAVTVLCCGLGAGVCIALSLLMDYIANRF